MIHLRSLAYKPSPKQDHFPFDVPVVQSFKGLEFTSDVTFLVGENGSGKSTLLEALACAVELPVVGSQAAHQDPTLQTVRQLAERFKLTWNKRVRRGFFMRSEDYFGFVRHMAAVKSEMQDDLKRIDKEFADRSDYARGLAKMAYARELQSMRETYGENGLDAQSHGESYFALFQSRFVPGGLYLLDEPEAPLSPSRQLTFLSLLRMAVQRDAQFIIATHSPIILAYPDATILSFDGERIQQADWHDLEHVAVMRSFLNDPQAYLRHLMDVSSE